MDILRQVFFTVWFGLIAWIAIYTAWSSRRNWRRHLSKLAAEGRLLNVDALSLYSGGVFMVQRWQGFPGWIEVRFTPVEFFKSGRTMEMLYGGELSPLLFEDPDRSHTIMGLPRWCRVASLKKKLMNANPKAVFSVFPEFI